MCVYIGSIALLINFLVHMVFDDTLGDLKVKETTNQSRAYV